ncbi:OprD family outer membrane porin [Acinetobacter bouvetii]|uniref:Porin-like protein NicP n=1 Tax=Acinetobacter bouvetii TaxID=202951 RepID=A0A811GAN7_9GAMM|nr:OprD family outer membrane porin [Acinetobacter bouvetii]CAB1211901.1 Porin-like protein NicP [Acinetobacter bouvetii]
MDIKLKPLLAIMLGNMALCNAVHAESNENQFKLVLKNAFIERNFDHENIKDSGSWSQGISGFYQSKYIPTVLTVAEKPIEIGMDASLQYALRLSDDRHIDDTVLPFNTNTQTQDRNFLKYGGTLKLKYDTTEFKVGELFLDLPITSVDTSRQLISSYWGGQIKSKVTDQLQLELGRITQVSPRYEEGFHEFSVTKNGVKQYSDGLNYLDLKYDVSPKLKAEYYYGNLEDLYDKHYLGLEYSWKNEYLKSQTRLKYFRSQDSGEAKAGEIDNHNIGLLENVSVGNHSVGLGYQQIFGDTGYPLPDGFLPELYFINWNTTGFFKKDEKSVHFLYGYDFKDYVPGLNTMVKYVYGTDFKDAQGRDNHESETNFILTYDIQNPKLKGLSFRWLYVNYDVEHGNSFQENRVLTTYTKKF